MLYVLRDGKPISFNQLVKKVNSNRNTIRNTCRELEIFGCIKIEQMKSHPKTNKPYSEAVITEDGRKMLRKIETALRKPLH